MASQQIIPLKVLAAMAREARMKAESAQVSPLVDSKNDKLATQFSSVISTTAVSTISANSNVNSSM